jgi:NADH-quinone oxidoreductase subunit J
MADVYFVGLAILTIGTSILALESKELIYGAIALAISMLGIAGFFLLLDSPFVAMFQITVYVGAVAVLVIFTVMLVRTQDLFSAKDDKGRKAGGIILMLLILGGIGESMLTYYSPVLIVLGLTLAGAVIGALALARREGLLKQNESAN